MNAIRGASGLLVFLSPNSVNSKWVFSEIAAAQSSGMIVFPVLLDRSTEIPLRLLNLQYMDMSNPDALKRGIASLSDFLLANLSILKKSTQQPSDIIVNTFAHNLAEQARTAGISESTDINTTTHNSPPESVFIVHGRDIPFRDEVENHLINIGVKPVVLSKMPNSRTSLFEKFKMFAGDTKFAVVLISGDDFGVFTDDYQDPTIGDKALTYRARQNVILELGYFYGLLGWDRVFVMYKKPSKRFPLFERPSDLDGILWEEYDASGQWKSYLWERLEEANFILR